MDPLTHKYMTSYTQIYDLLHKIYDWSLSVVITGTSIKSKVTD